MQLNRLTHSHSQRHRLKARNWIYFTNELLIYYYIREKHFNFFNVTCGVKPQKINNSYIVLYIYEYYLKYKLCFY